MVRGRGVRVLVIINILYLPPLDFFSVTPLTIGIANGKVDFLLFNQLRSPLEQALYIVCGAHTLSWSPRGQPKYNL
jgi:hypothetical protein